MKKRLSSAMLSLLKDLQYAKSGKGMAMSAAVRKTMRAAAKLGLVKIVRDDDNSTVASITMVGNAIDTHNVK